MFYLESRGFDTEGGKDALIAAFLNSTLVEMGSEALHNWLAEHLQDELEDPQILSNQFGLSDLHINHGLRPLLRNSVRVWLSWSSDSYAATYGVPTM